jgi:hypothetical protein
MSGLWGSRLPGYGRKALGAGTYGDMAPVSPPGVEVTARAEGVLTQSREGVVRSPDQVVGRGLLYKPMTLAKSGGAGETGGSGRSGGDERDTITRSERRARGPRWSLLGEPEAGRVPERAGGVRRRDISDEGHVKLRGSQGYADLALDLGGYAGRAWPMATHLGLKPYWRKVDVRFLGRALETSPWKPD